MIDINELRESLFSDLPETGGPWMLGISSDTLRAVLGELEALRAANQWLPIADVKKLPSSFFCFQPEFKNGRTHLRARVCLPDQAGHFRPTTHYRPLPAPPQD